MSKISGCNYSFIHLKLLKDENIAVIGVHFTIKKEKAKNGVASVYAAITINKERVIFALKKTDQCRGLGQRAWRAEGQGP